MTVRDLVNIWEKHANGELTQEAYQINLNLNDAAKVHALSEMYPKRSKEQILSELINAALSELEISLPYVAGKEIVSFDEMGDPIYEDVGPTPAFLSLTQKYMDKLKQPI